MIFKFKKNTLTPFKTIKIPTLFKFFIFNEFLFYIIVLKEYYNLNNYINKLYLNYIIYLINLILIKSIYIFKFNFKYIIKDIYSLNIYYIQLIYWFSIYLKKNISNLKTTKTISQKILLIKKVSKTRKKGRVKKFKVLLIVGNKSGWFGLGEGKDYFLQEAFVKARINAFKNITYIPFNYLNTFNNRIFFTKKNKKVLLNKNTFNLKTSSSYFIKVLFEIIGINNITSKILGVKNITSLLTLLFNKK